MTPPHPALPLAALALVAILVVIRTRRVGAAAYTFGHSDSAHDLQGMIFRITALMLAGFFLARLIWPGNADLAGPIPALSASWISWAGLAAAVFGGAIVVIGQWQMGPSWRIGLGRGPTELVSDGLFAHSRNPVFLGFLLVLLGCFLAAANALTATALGVGWAAMATQIRLEEAHLRATQSKRYHAYCAQVRRWL